MAAQPPRLGGNTAGKSFLQALKPKSIPLNTTLPSNPEIRPISNRVNGKIACIYAKEAVQVFASHYQNALIGKFMRGKPPMEEIHKSFQTMGFKGKFQVGSLDSRHILIRFEEKEDHRNLWMRTVFTIKGSTMRILKWTPDFSTKKTS